MARIAFFTESLPPAPHDSIAEFSFELMRSIADLQHDVRIFSTYVPQAELPPTHPRMNILRPFRKWSWLEIPKALPFLLEFQPEILHIIQPHAEANRGWSSAMSALPTLTTILGRPRVVVSLFDIGPTALERNKLILFGADHITVSNRAQAELVGDHLRLQGKSTPVTVLTLPRLGATSTGYSGEHRPDAEVARAVAHFMNDESDTIFIPGLISEQEEFESLVEILAELLSRFPQSKVLFGGGWGDTPALRRMKLMRVFEARQLGSRVMVAGDLNPATEAFALSKARAVFTAALYPGSLRLMQVVRGGLENSSVMILSRGHVDLDPLPWRDREQAFIAGPAPQHWGETLAEALSSPQLATAIRARLPDFNRRQVSDHPGNLISRLYAGL